MALVRPIHPEPRQGRIGGCEHWPAPSTATPVHATVTVPGRNPRPTGPWCLRRWRYPTARRYRLRASGSSTISGALRSRDTDLMIGALQALGVTVDRRRRRRRADRQRRLAPRPLVHASTAAWPARCCGSCPPVAALSTETVTFDGDEQARSRPIAPLLDALRSLGVHIDGDSLPFEVRGDGSVRGGTVEIDASASSQFVSGLLLSGATFTEGLTVVHTGADGAAVRPAPRRDDGVDAARRRCRRRRLRAATAGGSPRARSRRGSGSSNPTCPMRCRSWPPPSSAAVPVRITRLADGQHTAGRRHPRDPRQPGFGHVRQGNSHLEVQGATSYGGIDVDLRRGRRTGPFGRGDGRTGRSRIGVAPARHRAPARARDRPAGRAEHRDQPPRRSVRGDRGRLGDHRGADARRYVAVLRRSPDGNRGGDRRAAGARRRGRGHRHHRQDAARLSEDVGRHAGRPDRRSPSTLESTRVRRVRCPGAPGRGSRPRTKTRPEHADAAAGRWSSPSTAAGGAACWAATRTTRSPRCAPVSWVAPRSSSATRSTSSATCPAGPTPWPASCGAVNAERCCAAPPMTPILPSASSSPTPTSCSSWSRWPIPRRVPVSSSAP